MQITDLPEELRELIGYENPMLFFVSRTLAQPLLSAGNKIDLLINMGYNVVFYKNSIIWRVFGDVFYQNDVDTGDKYWFDRESRFHRINGPAIERSGYTSWFLHGNLHREDGPAIVCPSGRREWWIHDKFQRRSGFFTENDRRHKRWLDYAIAMMRLNYESK